MTWWLAMFLIALIIRRGCVKALRRKKAAVGSPRVGGPRVGVSRNTALRYEQDRPFAECFDDNEIGDDL